MNSPDHNFTVGNKTLPSYWAYVKIKNILKPEICLLGSSHFERVGTEELIKNQCLEKILYVIPDSQLEQWSDENAIRAEPATPESDFLYQINRELKEANESEKAGLYLTTEQEKKVSALEDGLDLHLGGIRQFLAEANAKKSV